MAGVKAKVHNPAGAAAKAITSRRMLLAVWTRRQLWGPQSSLHIPEDFNQQVKMLNDSCDPREQI